MALTGAHRGTVQVHLHEKALIVVGALLAGEAVFQHLAALPLDQLLEGGLIVPGAVQSLDLPAEDIPLDDLPGRADAPVQIDRRQHRLHCVGLDGGALPAAAGLLSFSQAQVLPQIQLRGHLHQALLAHQGRPGAGQLPLGQIGVVAVQVVGHHHTQNRIPQKFQPLIALELAPALVGTGAVGQGIFQQGCILEGISQLFF